MAAENYKGVDYYLIDDLLTDEEKSIRDKNEPLTLEELKQMGDQPYLSCFFTRK